MSQTQNTATKTAKTKAPAKILLMQSVTAEAAMATAETLRIQANDYNEKYVVQGRKALLALMVDIYQLYHATQSSTDKGAEFMRQVKVKLEELKVEVRKSSPASSQLLRYICKDFDDKQVSIYGRSLAVAFRKGIGPSGFADFIENTKGGFAGVRGDPKPTNIVGDESVKADTTLANIRIEATVETIEVTDWSEGEEYRVLIAVRNDDDTADIKNAKLSEASLKSVIIRYETDKNARLKPSKDQQHEIDKVSLEELTAEAANAEVKRGNIEAELNEAITNGNTELSDVLRAKLRTASLLAKSVETTRKQLAATLKDAEAVTA